MPRMTDCDRETIARMAREGATVAEIANAIYQPHSIVWGYCKRCGIVTTKGRPGYKSRFDDRAVADILSRFERGERPPSIARSYAAAPQTIYALLNTQGYRRQGNRLVRQSNDGADKQQMADDIVVVRCVAARVDGKGVGPSL